MTRKVPLKDLKRGSVFIGAVTVEKEAIEIVKTSLRKLENKDLKSMWKPDMALPLQCVVFDVGKDDVGRDQIKFKFTVELPLDIKPEPREKWAQVKFTTDNIIANRWIYHSFHTRTRLDLKVEPVDACGVSVKFNGKYHKIC